MDATAVPPALAERLGPEAASGLVDLFNAAGEECVQHAATQAVDRFERRLTEEFSKLRVEMVQGDTAVREELAALRSDIRQETGTLRSDLRQGITGLNSELRQEMTSLKSDLRREMTSLKSDLRLEMTSLGSDLRQEMASQKFDLLKWSFLFWIGQVVAVTGIIATLLRMSGR